MTEIEFRIGVTLVYSDGRRETITVFRRGTDDESTRHNVWHEYRSRFADIPDMYLITSLIGMNIAAGTEAAIHPRLDTPPPRMDRFQQMNQGNATPPRNPHP